MHSVFQPSFCQNSVVEDAGIEIAYWDRNRFGKSARILCIGCGNRGKTTFPEKSACPATLSGPTTLFSAAEWVEKMPEGGNWCRKIQKVVLDHASDALTPRLLKTETKAIWVFKPEFVMDVKKCIKNQQKSQVFTPYLLSSDLTRMRFNAKFHI